MAQLFGVAVREQHLRTVDFVCPKCGLDRIGSVMQPRRWMMALGVPALPLGDLDRVVRCDECHHGCDLGVLDVPTTNELATLLEQATLAAMTVAVRSASGDRVQVVSERALDLLVDAGFDIDHRRFAGVVARTPTLDAIADIRRLSSELTAHGKQNFLHRLTSVVMADGSLTTGQREALLTIGRALGMAPPHVHGILAVNRIGAAAA